MKLTSRGANAALGAGGHRGSARPWHLKNPAPWPTATTSQPVAPAQLAPLVTAASERHLRRQHGDPR